MADVRSDTINGIKWSFFERFSVQGIQFLIGLILARILSPQDFGTVGMLGIFFAISQSFIDSGFSSALVRKLDRTEQDFCTVFYFNIVVGLICYLILFLLSPFIADFFHTPILSPVLKVSALNLLIGSLVTVQSAKLTIKIDFKSQAKASSTSAFISGAVGIILAYCGYGVWALVAQGLINSGVYAVVIWWIAKWRPSLIYSWKSFHELFSYGSKLLASGLLHTLYMNMTTLVIGRFYTPKDLGYYSRGESLAGLPSKNITGILQRVTFPILSRLQDDDARLVHVYRKYIKLTSLCIIFMMTLLAALSKPIVILLLTEKWTEAIIYLQIFCFALMFDHICQLNLNLLEVKGRSDLFLRLEIIKKVIAFLILIASIPFGVIAICISKIVYTQIAVFINTYYTGKLFGLSYRKQVADFLPYLLMSVLVCAPAFLLSEYCNLYVLDLCLGVLISLGLYWLILKLTKDAAYQDFYTMVLAKIIQKIHR